MELYRHLITDFWHLSANPSEGFPNTNPFAEISNSQKEFELEGRCIWVLSSSNPATPASNLGLGIKGKFRPATTGKDSHRISSHFCPKVFIGERPNQGSTRPQEFYKAHSTRANLVPPSQATRFAGSVQAPRLSVGEPEPHEIIEPINCSPFSEAGVPCHLDGLKSSTLLIPWPWWLHPPSPSMSRSRRRSSLSASYLSFLRYLRSATVYTTCFSLSYLDIQHVPF